MITGMFTYQDLTIRLQYLSKPLALLIGSGVTLPEVPGVAEIVAMIRASFEASPEGSRAFEEALEQNETPFLYQAAAEYLAGVRGMDELNLLIRRVVLRAIRPGFVLTLSSDPEPEELASLEHRPEIWHLNRGIEALGKLIYSRSDLFSGPVLTTNFDPLIEVSIRRAGGIPASVVLSNDGSPGQFEPDREIPVIHLHGRWRGPGDTLHTCAQLQKPRPNLKRWLDSVLRDHVVLVLGYGGWPDIFTQTLHELAEDSLNHVLWCLYEKRQEITTYKHETVIKPFMGLPRVTFFTGIDASKLLPEIWEKMGNEREVGREILVATASLPSEVYPADVISSQTTSLFEQESSPTPSPQPLFLANKKVKETSSIPVPIPSALANGKRNPIPLSHWPRSLVAILLLLAAIALWLWLDHQARKNVRINILVDDKPVHLGDNIFLTFLAPDPAEVPDPLSQSRNDLVYFDKAVLKFEAHSLSANQAKVLAGLSDVFSRLDFSSYRHVRLVDEAEVHSLGLDPMPSPRVVQVGRDKFLVWARDRGNYHQSRAAVLVSYRVDLIGRVQASLPSPGDFDVTRVAVAVELSHGGKPLGEGGEVLLIVNGKILDLSTRFQHLQGQQRETVEVDITPWAYFDPALGPTELSLVTTPVLEKTPVPGLDDPDPQARPVHFRDVMINHVALWIDASVNN